MVLNIRTTLEAFRAPVFRQGPDKDGFSLGARGNIAEVLETSLESGASVLRFGDGLPTPSDIEDPEMGLTNGSSVFGHTGLANQRTHRSQMVDTLSERGV